MSETTSLSPSPSHSEPRLHPVLPLGLCPVSLPQTVLVPPSYSLPSFLVYLGEGAAAVGDHRGYSHSLGQPSPFLGRPPKALRRLLTHENSERVPPRLINIASPGQASGRGHVHSVGWRMLRALYELSPSCSHLTWSKSQKVMHTLPPSLPLALPPLLSRTGLLAAPLHAGCVPTSGPLHRPFSLPGTLFPRYQYNCSLFLCPWPFLSPGESPCTCPGSVSGASSTSYPQGHPRPLELGLKVQRKACYRGILRLGTSLTSDSIPKASLQERGGGPPLPHQQSPEPPATCYTQYTPTVSANRSRKERCRWGIERQSKTQNEKHRKEERCGEPIITNCTPRHPTRHLAPADNSLRSVQANRLRQTLHHPQQLGSTGATPALHQPWTGRALQQPRTTADNR